MKVNAGQASSTLIPEYIGSDFDKVTLVSENIEYIKNVAEGIAGMPVKSYIGEFPPQRPVAGSEWYCTKDGRTYVWYEDADSSQWVESSPQSTNDGLERNLDTILDPKYKQIREALRRSYAEAGYTLVAGSFESGGTLTSPTDVLLYEVSGKVYSWAGTFPKVVSPSTDPAAVGSRYVPRTDVVLRGNLSGSDGESLIGYYSSISSLRDSLSLPIGGKVRVASWHDGWMAISRPPVGGGIFIVTTDITSTDNGGTVIVNASGQRLYRMLDGGESVDSFGAIADYNVTTGTGADNSLAIQNALNAGFGKLNGKYGIGSTVTLSSGKLWSDDAIPYYASTQYYGATKKDYEGSALCALSSFSSALPLVKTAIGNEPSSVNDSSHYGAEIQNVVLDAAEYAKHGLSHDYDGRPMRDRQLMLDNVLISGAVSHGMVASNVIAIRSRNLHVSACNGFSIYNTYGVTDCHHSGMYLHTSNGGVYFGDGCAENQFFGGKLEDLYGLPIYAIGSGVGKLDFHGMSMVNNNTMIAKVSGSANIKLIDCRLGSPKFGSLTAMSAENGGVIALKDTAVSGYATASNADNGKVYVGPGCEITTAAWATAANAGRIVIEEKSQVQSISLAASSTVTVDFVGAVPELSGGYFKYAELNFSLLYSNYPQTPAGTQCAFGKLIFGQAGTDVGVTAQLINSPNSAYIASVSASIVNSTTIRLSITCGASVASGGGTGSATIQLTKG